MAIVPLSDASRSTASFPVATALIVAANAICFILELSGGDAFVLRWSAIAAQITSGHHLETLFTSMYMHASWSHIIGNMLFLWAFGPAIEDSMGSLLYVVFYTLGGLAGMLCQVAVSPHSTLPNLGASGAIASVMGAFIVKYPRDQIKSILVVGWFARITFIPAALLIGVWFLLQLISVGVIVNNSQQGGVAYLAHIGGVIFGIVFGRLFELPRRLAR